MDAIETRFLGATDYRGSRITATTRGNRVESVTVSYDSALNSFDNHRAAAVALIRKLRWMDVTFVPGSTTRGYVFVADTNAGDIIREYGESAS